jgi:hypothetical protein
LNPGRRGGKPATNRFSYGAAEELLASLYKSSGRASSDADITELLSFRSKSILAGDLNAKHPFWNSVVSKPSGEKLMDLFDLSAFEISASQCSTHSPAGNVDVLDILVHKYSERQILLSLIFWTQNTYQ